MTGLVTLFKLDSNHGFFSPCDFEIRQITSKNNRADLPGYIKLCELFQSHEWIKTWVTVRKRSMQVKIGNFLSHVTEKFYGWPWKKRAPVLCYFKRCASFRSHRSIQTGVTVRKHAIRVKKIKIKVRPLIYSDAVRFHHVVLGPIYFSNGDFPWYCIVCMMDLYPAQGANW